MGIGGPGSGEEFIIVDDFDFFNFEGVDYDETSGLSEVEALFYDGEFLGLSFAADDFSFIPGFFALDEAYVGYDIDSGAGAADIIYKKKTTTTTSVPEPSSVLGLIFMGSSMLLVGKKVGRSGKGR